MKKRFVCLFIVVAVILTAVILLFTRNKKTSDYTVEKNETSLYDGSEKIVDVPMGIIEKGEQKMLCKIKMPTTYSIRWSRYCDDDKAHYIPAGDWVLLSDIVDKGVLENAFEYPDTVTIKAPESVNNEFTFIIGKKDEVTVRSAMLLSPGGIQIGQDSEHEGYIHYAGMERSSDYCNDIVFVYQLSPDWTLVVQNNGYLKDEISLEQIGHELYEMVNTEDL